MSESNKIFAAPSNCHLCKGSAPTSTIIRQFQHTDYGHLACRKCGITFDSNANHFLSVRLNAEEIRNISDESEYRRHFIETSQIASHEGEVYTDFDWDDNESLKSGVSRHVLDTIKRYTDNVSGLRILDLGCGNGFTAVELAKSNPLFLVTAVDPSPSVLGVNGQGNVRALQGTLDSLKFDDASFDVIVIIGNLMLHNNPELTLREAKRILRPEGLLIFDFKNADSFVRRFLRYAARISLQGMLPRSLVERSFVNMRYGYRKNYMLQVIERIGFRELENYSKPPRLLEFANKAELQSGFKGFLWRLTDYFDRLFDQRAWVQVICRVKKVEW